MTNNNYTEYEDELFYSFIDDNKQVDSNKITLPAIVQTYTNDCTMASNFNSIPASLSFFVMLGQLCKDMIAIPSGVNIDDTRLQFLWLQTSGTGKSTLTNWYKPIVRRTFELINLEHGTNFNIFDVTDYTDAALIGSFEKREEQILEDNGQTRTVMVDTPIPGQLEGDGLAMWDEFEYSGVFKQSQHKENSIVYLNTFMNTIWGETWIISKKLKLGDEPIECKCKRSVFATTYIPKLLTTVITEKGVLQRKLIFIWEVPQHQQMQMRRKLISDWGTIKDRDKPRLKYASSFVTLYDTVKERYEEVDCDPLKTIKITRAANDALTRECILMEEYITDSRQEVFEAMETFINRILKHIQKLAILCCVAEAPSITDKSKRFIVSPNHVLQASSLVRQCYKSLVSWLDEALRVEKRAVSDNANLGVFKSICRKEADENGWVNKAELFAKVRQHTKKGVSTLYKWWPKVEEYFEERKIVKSVYVRLLEDVE
jgi:hypothetical protein